MIHFADLFAGGDVENAHRFIRAAERELAAIGRERCAEERIVAQHDGMLLLARGDVPDLHFAEARRIAARPRPGCCRRA